MNSKKCKKCNETKELSEFNKSKCMADGRFNQCKKCQSEYKKIRDAKKREFNNQFGIV